MDTSSETRGKAKDPLFAAGTVAVRGSKSVPCYGRAAQQQQQSTPPPPPPPFRSSSLQVRCSCAAAAGTDRAARIYHEQCSTRSHQRSQRLEGLSPYRPAAGQVEGSLCRSCAGRYGDSPSSRAIVGAARRAFVVQMLDALQGADLQDEERRTLLLLLALRACRADYSTHDGIPATKTDPYPQPRSLGNNNNRSSSSSPPPPFRSSSLQVRCSCAAAAGTDRTKHFSEQCSFERSFQRSQRLGGLSPSFARRGSAGLPSACPAARGGGGSPSTI